jgi:broad specificity phosphatase PhoE
MPRIYYVRHGENIANITREFSHKKVDYSLTEKGTKQAEATAGALEEKRICSIYCSPLKRAIETADVIGKRLGLNPHNH